MNSKKLVALLAATAMTAGMVAGCGSSTDTAASTAASTASSEATSEAVTSEAAASSEAAETSESATTEEASADADQLPRDQTLYFSGQQWGSVNDYNPLSGNSNNGMVLAASTFSRILVYETLMMYDPLTTECKPLLATDYSWNDDHTEMTVHLNPDAKWSDGTQVTSADIAYTWEAQKKYNTAGYGTFSPFIDTIEAVDDTTFTIKMVLNDDGKPVNYKYGEQYLISPYQMQKAYLQKVEERDGEDADKVTTDRMDDLVASGPYKPYIDNDQKVVLIRDDNYWGQADSMWGKLPVPKYIAHAIYKDNAAGDTALRQGEVDVSQQFTSNVQDLWEKDGLDISTWLDEAPYDLAMQTPSAFFNCKKPGLDNATVRKAIAMAVDYDQIIASAMSGQSPTFEEYPRCVVAPNDTLREKYIDYDALKDYQFAGGDVDGANKLLDDAGIVDTDGDGIREIDGTNLSFKAECPSGWSDWNASLEIVAAAGQSIGIDIQTYFPEASVYYTDMTTHQFDICMWGGPGQGPLAPYDTAMFYLSKDYGDLEVDWNGNFGQYENKDAEAILKALPQETDDAKLKEDYTELSKILLEDCPAFALMYRPGEFYTVNESVWTNFPAQDDGRGIPPLDCTDGYGVAALYDLELAE